MSNGPRILIIGAGSRGCAYARAIRASTPGEVVAVADPVAFKRSDLWRKYVKDSTEEWAEYDDWRDFVQAERTRPTSSVDGAFVCTLDETHAEIITTLASAFPDLHIMSEKPLATTLEACLDIYRSLGRGLFSIGHVLRYSPHNMLLRKLLLEDEAIGEIVSVEHTEPVGWWHFSHSYVRGNWRKESVTAPSLLTKSCHDIDLLLWLLCSPPKKDNHRPPHLPSLVSSTGHLVHFKASRKPAAAGAATNCLSCAAEPDCQFSAKKIYHQAFRRGCTDWPVKIVAPEIENCLETQGLAAAEAVLLERLGEDYDDASAKTSQVSKRPWFGRCVYESDNDVCDDQVVTITWDDDPISAQTNGATNKATSLKGRGAKTATMHMIAFTEDICERRSKYYGTQGEITADSRNIKVHNFTTGKSQTYNPHQAGGGHGGGDDGLARQFVCAIDAVKNQGMSIEDAQQQFIGCTSEDIIRSHTMVFAAEEARKERKVLNWQTWWETNVESRLRGPAMTQANTLSTGEYASPVCYAGEDHYS